MNCTVTMVQKGTNILNCTVKYDVEEHRYTKLWNPPPKKAAEL